MIVRWDAPAKINLWLEVIRRREDGYHDLSSLMVPLQLCDELEVELKEDAGILIECSEPGVPSDESNLCWKATCAFMKKTGINRGVHIRLQKNIPHAAGLGGGSSDAAATMLALNHLMGNRLTERELHDTARHIGADVPFFLGRRPALATGIGDLLEPVEALPPYWLVLIKPPINVSTRRVYESLTLTRGESRITVPLFLARPWDVHLWLQNDLENFTGTEYPVVGALKRWLVNQGALGALMSGSGSSVFGVFQRAGIAERVGESARQEWSDCWVAVSGVYGYQGADPTEE